MLQHARNLCVFISLVTLSGCKLQPNQLRSSLSRSDAFELIDKNSVGFKRREDQKSGDLFFTLKGPYQCRIAYWAEDLSVTPNAQSPIIRSCPEDQTQINFFIEKLELGIPYTFQINVWPEELSPDSSASLIFAERTALTETKTSYIVVARHIIPRQSTELYTYQFEGISSLLDIRNTYQNLYNIKEGEECSKEPSTQDIAFPRYTSLEDANARPLHGLSEVSSDSYAIAKAEEHPFYPTRLVQFYPAVEPLQNWIWNFKWEDKAFQFEVFPPGFMEETLVSSGENSFSIDGRNLAGASEKFEIANTDLSVRIRPQYPSDLSFVHITINNPFKDTGSIFCTFRLGEESYKVPSSLISELETGEYDINVAFETVQIHYKSNTPYPPWLLVNQDWAHARLEKR